MKDKIRPKECSIHPNKGSRRLHTHNHFFSEEIKYRVFDDRIEFEHPTLGWTGKSNTPYKVGYTYYMSIKCDWLECKTYELHEEEDKIIIYRESF